MGKIRDNIRGNLEHYLNLKGMSQKELAEKLGVSQSAVTCWIKGKNSPDIEVVAKICDIFNISVIDLFGTDGKDEKTENLELAISLFNELNPLFQEYALKQMKTLKELQYEVNE
ncbi:helix-turn-helix domain-containing protein [Eubacteriales bacterium OttesenSCG-928-G02]|nr:helix-turn-helix domain-containing protein [Eubacteriales bacterium OttesenSCG-928-G02]